MDEWPKFALELARSRSWPRSMAEIIRPRDRDISIRMAAGRAGYSKNPHKRLLLTHLKSDMLAGPSNHLY